MDELTRAVAAAKLNQTYPGLVAHDGNALVSAARNLRIELKRAFPGIKFSVRTERFAGGDAIDVGWTDGPTTREVEDLAKKYQAGRFDCMDDSYTYDRSMFKEVFGDAKYVSCHRSYSDDLVATAIVQVVARFGGQPITVEAYRRGGARNWRNSDSPNAVDMGRELSLCLSGLSCMPQS